ncbi:MAG TPA: CRISPR-associated endonuclease Cas2 [Bacteroidales bacterium]|nr:MAG: CRISPR-associated endonuclease Cas2 [Bacteroidetes bacterium GWF2_35_48]OFY93575.1 MAG: CRISPR-associated endonuclease Cas2 [Bacteroidetes bacterium RIFOXYC12_FULL_35_7]HBX50717.1 CRISPR-associated endonuclease Cas2 [Bacteroidales bacterium]
MSHERLNAYHIMWLFVFFDLPVVKKKERKDAARFRKELQNDGFTMMQYSVYIRHCASTESADVHEKRVKKFMPGKGYISILRITDKQYGNIVNFWGVETKPLTPGPKQLELF